MKTLVLILALLCSCVYIPLFFMTSPKAVKLSNKIQKPCVILSAVLLVIYIIL